MDNTLHHSGARAPVADPLLPAPPSYQDASPAAHPRAGEPSAGESRTGERNDLLRALPTEAYASLLPHLEPVEIAGGQVLWAPDETIRAVYFPLTTVCSILTPLADESPVESATVGREGMVGVPIVLDASSTHSHTLGQVPGTAVRVDAGRFREWLASANGARPLLLRYAQALLEQTAQSVACNRKHEMDERCARWLLATHDRVGSDSFPLTHQFLAAMLGVRRASVTVAAGMLQRAGLIRYSRGQVTILDRQRLEEASCECHRVVRQLQARLLGSATETV